MICEHFLEKGFIDNYSICSKYGKTGANAQDKRGHKLATSNDVVYM
jgi:hypothetical protein